MSTDSIPTRKGKATNSNQQGATRAEDISLNRRIILYIRVVVYVGEIFNLNFLPSNVNVLEEDAYLHQWAMNNLCPHEEDNLADDEAQEMPSNLDYNQLICLFGFRRDNSSKFP